MSKQHVQSDAWHIEKLYELTQEQGRLIAELQEKVAKLEAQVNEYTVAEVIDQAILKGEK